MATKAPSKWTSRKFWITVAVGIAWGICEAGGIDLPDEVLKVVLAYLGCEAAVDIARAIRKA